MIHINLLGREDGAHTVEQQRQLRVVYAVVAANIVGLLLVSLTLRTVASSRARRIAKTDTKVQELLKIAQDVEGEEKERQLLEEKRRVIAELERREVGPFRILEALSDATPTRLWLKEFTDKSGEVTITGLAIDDPTVAEFLSQLQRSPHFTGLELVESAQAEEGKMRVKKFVMRGPLSYAGNGHTQNANGHGGNGVPKAATNGKNR